MRKLFLSSLVLASVVVLFGCPKKKGAEGADAGEEAGAEQPTAAGPDAAAAPPPPAAAAAKNTADVARFPGETKIENEAAEIASTTIVRTAPKGGSVVTTLKPGADVTKIASFQDSLLVSFADPKEASSTLMGWVSKDAFVAAVISDAGMKDSGVDGGPRDGGTDAGPKDAGAVDAAAVVDAGKPALKCPAGQVGVLTGAEPVCKKRCSTDADCGGAKGACGPAAAEKGGRAVQVCVH